MLQIQIQTYFFNTRKQMKEKEKSSLLIYFKIIPLFRRRKQSVMCIVADNMLWNVCRAMHPCKNISNPRILLEIFFFRNRISFNLFFPPDKIYLLKKNYYFKKIFCSFRFGMIYACQEINTTQSTTFIDCGQTPPSHQFAPRRAKTPERAPSHPSTPASLFTLCAFQPLFPSSRFAFLFFAIRGAFVLPAFALIYPSAYTFWAFP